MALTVDGSTEPLGLAPVRRRRSRLLWPVAGTVVLATAALWVALVDPNHPGHYPTCPFLALTGLWCPGCGALRACHDLMHLDVAGALARNPLVVVAAPYVLYEVLCGWRRALGRRAWPSATSLPAWSLYALLVLVLAFTVLRNLPGWAWLSPA